MSAVRWNPGFRMLMVFIIAAVALQSAACGAKKRPAASPVETKEWHVRQGKALLEKAGATAADVARAESEFNKALEMEPKYAPAFSGLAAVKLSRNELDAARDMAKRAREIDDRDYGSYVVMGRVLAATPRKDALQEAEKEFVKAEELVPGEAEAYFRHGEALARAYRFTEAKGRFEKVLELKKGYREEANALWEKMQLIERASPGTENGRRLALVDRLNRAEMGILFADELGLVRLIEKRRPAVYDTAFRTPTQAAAEASGRPTGGAVAPGMPRDIEGHWGESALIDILKLKLRSCSAMPDGTFQPNAPVSRAEFALMVEDVMVLVSGDESLTRRYIGEEKSHYPDVRTDHPAYNAINLTVQRGVMKAGPDGRFDIGGGISGADALLAIRTLSALL